MNQGSTGGLSGFSGDAQAFVKVNDLTKIFGETVAVQSVNLTINRNEIFAFRQLWLWQVDVAAHAGRV